MSGADIRLLQPGDESTVDAFLAQHADSSLFLRSNLRKGIADRGEIYHGPWAGAFEDGRLVGVAQHSRFGSMLPQAPRHAGELARAAARSSAHPVRGFVGPRAQALAARAALGLDGAPMGVESFEGLYAVALDALVVPPMLASGRWQCRRARRAEIDLLVEWRAGFNAETNGQADDPALHTASREEIERGLAEGASWVLEADGVPVAFQQFNAMLPDVVQVGGVWTPPSLRSRGYARAIVAGALLAVRRDGVRRAVLFTGDDNIPAQRAYHALGFTRVGDWALLFLKVPATF